MGWGVLRLLLLRVVALANLLEAGCSRAGSEVWVDSAHGDDRAAGTRAAPLLTLERARDVARQAPRPTVVRLSGEFRQRGTLELDSAQAPESLEKGAFPRCGLCVRKLYFNFERICIRPDQYLNEFAINFT